MNEVSNNLGNLFETIVSKNKDKESIVYADGRKITYAALDDISRRIASKFHSKGLIKGDRVLISGDKSPLMFASIIAALKIGIIYSIYDSEMPVDRLKLIVLTCEPRILLGSVKEHISVAMECGVVPILFSDLKFELESQPEPEPEFLRAKICLIKKDDPCGADMAYIVFTSGSTGAPKGAAMSHSNVLTLIDWSSKEFSFGPGEILTNLNPCYFDNFVFDFYSSIFTGATLVPFTRDELRNPPQLLKAIYELGCTSWFSVPSLLIYLDAMKAFSTANFSKLQRIIFGGEGYPKSKLINLYNNFKGCVSFYNVYGPSECTCIASCYKVSDSDFEELDGFLPIGSLINNFEYFIIDENFKITPKNEKGELCLIGPAVGLGYFNQSELTANSFIPEVLIEVNSGNRTVYRTGDIVSFNSSDRKLYIFGRKDNQIKHAGYRIELEDIENALMRLPYVTQACCIHNYQSGVSRITAFLAVTVESQTLKTKNDLSQHLPVYMMPTHFKFLSNLPKNKNGKVDRVALAKQIKLL
jgi:D-alanine--poly(phosphoribitol) ligase subunit 1